MNRVFDLTAEVRLEDLLGLQPPPATRHVDVFRQLRYIDDYLRDPEMNCTAGLLEDFYYDKNYSVEHAVFYSSSLEKIPRHCKRVHFFRGISSAHLTLLLAEMRSSWRTLGEETTRARLRDLSEKHYLGFACIKPLRGAPLGFTVLRPFPRESRRSGSSNGTPYHRMFGGVRQYVVHIGNLPFQVEGLSFQQQDAGVAACSSTAIWATISKLRDFEDIGRATPADITRLAFEQSYVAGRSMPTDGLQVAQMCAAIHALGFEPVLIKTDSFERIIRPVVHAAVKSGMPPILILDHPVFGTHAAPVVGTRYESVQSVERTASGWCNEIDGINGLYVHDDRLGPYVLARLAPNPNSSDIQLRLFKAPRGEPSGSTAHSRHITKDIFEDWKVRLLLIPTYPKIRQDFSEIAVLALEQLVPFISSSWSSETAGQGKRSNVTIDFWATPSSKYVTTELAANTFTLEALRRLSEEVPFPRYLYAIRFRFQTDGELKFTIDLLVDSTATKKAPSFLAAVSSESGDGAAGRVLLALRTKLRQGRKLVPAYYTGMEVDIAEGTLMTAIAASDITSSINLVSHVD